MTRQVDALQAKPAPLARTRFLSTLDLANIPRRGLILLALLLAVLIAAPAFASDYLLSILILILYFAYTGQAWNVMMGFAGQLSLGHALYVGIGAYTTAALFIHFGTPPWIGLLAAVPIAMATGAVIGFLAFRFRVAGAYFAILTIAFAEFARIGFDHWDWVGASSGLFLPVATYTQNDLWHLRGRPIMFYYLILAMTVLAFLLCRWLLRSRLGYFWQAVREDEEAARAVGIATFRTKMAAVVISAGLTSVAGMFYAFYYNNLFAEQVFSIGRSIEIILGPVIGGVGTLFGPVLGAFLLTGLAESMTEILGLISVDLPGAKQVALARAQARFGEAAMNALLSVAGVSKRFRGLLAVGNVSLDVMERDIFAIIGPTGAGKTTLFNTICGVFRPDGGTIAFAGERIDGHPPDEVCRRGIGRTFQLVRPFPGLSVLDNVIIGALLRHASVEDARARAEEVLRRLDLFNQRHQRAASLTLPDRKRLEVARALATQPRLVLLDEVMAGLRPTEVDRMVAIMTELNRAGGLTIVLIEHVMRAVMALATRVLVLHHGAVIAQGAPAEVVHDPQVIKSYLGAEEL
jgi:branched-chain amino acid transport system permease protein